MIWQACISLEFYREPASFRTIYSCGWLELEIYYLIPLMMVLVPFVYLIRAKLFSKIRGRDLESFEAELLEKKSVWGQIKDLFR